jgi:hypothetical protein
LKIDACRRRNGLSAIRNPQSILDMPGVIATYDKLRQKVGEETAQILVEYIETAVREGTATKEDIHALKEDIHNLEKQGISNKVELERQVEAVRMRVEEGKVELERRIDDLERRLERRFERFSYVIIFLLVLFNGDKVLSFLSGLLGLAK